MARHEIIRQSLQANSRYSAELARAYGSEADNARVIGWHADKACQAALVAKLEADRAMWLAFRAA